MTSAPSRAELRAKGSLELDFAQRFGGELLQVLTYLEEQRVVHKDIKPANIGLAAGRERQRLVLLDFSLAETAPKHTRVGTPSWRDPFLQERGSWDDHADRYAAAAVLYAMLTGAGLRYDKHSQQVPVQAELFEASLRDKLSHFFERATRQSIDQRFGSAQEMAATWQGAFTQAEALSQHPSPAPEELSLDTRVEALGFSLAARNTLARAGVVDIAGLLSLPRNHLSAIPGAGHAVGREIVERAEALRQQFEPPASPLLAPQYQGLPLPLSQLAKLSPPQIQRLREAGIHTLRELAECTVERLEQLLPAKAKPWAAPLQRHQEPQRDEDPPLLEASCCCRPKSKSPSKLLSRVRALVGLDAIPAEGGAAPAAPTAASRPAPCCSGSSPKNCTATSAPCAASSGSRPPPTSRP